MNNPIKKSIRKGAIVSSTIISSCLFLSLLVSCGPDNKNKAADEANDQKVAEARKIAVQTIGGYGNRKGQFLVDEACSLRKKEDLKAHKNNDSSKLPRSVDNKHLVVYLMTETEKGHTSPKQSKKNQPTYVVKNEITGAYKKFVEAILEDNAGDKGKKEKQRHAELYILVQGLNFVSDMVAMLDKEDSNVTALIKRFEEQITEVSQGLRAKVEEYTNVNFQTTNKETRKLTQSSQKAARELLGEVQTAGKVYKDAIKGL